MLAIMNNLMLNDTDTACEQNTDGTAATTDAFGFLDLIAQLELIAEDDNFD